MFHTFPPRFRSRLLGFSGCCLAACLLSSCESPNYNAGYSGGSYVPYDPIESANNSLLHLGAAAYNGAPLRYPDNYRHPNHDQYHADVVRRSAPGRSVRVPSNYGDHWYSQSGHRSHSSHSNNRSGNNRGNNGEQYPQPNKPRDGHSHSEGEKPHSDSSGSSKPYVNRYQ